MSLDELRQIVNELRILEMSIRLTRLIELKKLIRAMSNWKHFLVNPVNLINLSTYKVAVLCRKMRNSSRMPFTSV